MQKSLHFISGLQRSGSTVLTKLLNQHPSLFATSTSPFLDYLIPAVQQLHNIKNNHSSGHYVNVKRILQASAFAFFDTDKPVILDKNRGWIHNYKAIQADLLDDPKIILTLRPIDEVITSFHTILKKNGQVLTPEQIFLGYISELYTQLIQASIYKEKLCIVTYDDITLSPIETLRKIEDYLSVPHYNFDLNNIIDTDPENDDKWGIKDLHKIRSSISRVSVHPSTIMTNTELDFCHQLTTDLYNAYDISAQIPIR